MKKSISIFVITCILLLGCNSEEKRIKKLIDNYARLNLDHADIYTFNNPEPATINFNQTFKGKEMLESLKMDRQSLELWVSDSTEYRERKKKYEKHLEVWKSDSLKNDKIKVFAVSYTYKNKNSFGDSLEKLGAFYLNENKNEVIGFDDFFRNKLLKD